MTRWPAPRRVRQLRWRGHRHAVQVRGRAGGRITPERAVQHHKFVKKRTATISARPQQRVGQRRRRDAAGADESPVTGRTRNVDEFLVYAENVARATNATSREQRDLERDFANRQRRLRQRYVQSFVNAVRRAAGGVGAPFVFLGQYR